jgi:predicted nucleic acid-binding protein
VTPIVLDTDVASGLIKKNLPSSLDAKLIGHELLTTFVSAGELERWTIQRQLGARRKAEIDRWISGPLLTGGRDVARKWARSWPTPTSEVDRAPSTTRGSPPAASLTSFRSQR